MPETGIEPVRALKARRILSPVRLPVPPLRQSHLSATSLIILHKIVLVNTLMDILFTHNAINYLSLQSLPLINFSTTAPSKLSHSLTVMEVQFKSSNTV